MTHASATHVTVSLDRHDARLTMSVVDDGGGIAHEAATRRPGLGLVSLGERVRMLGGTLIVRSAPDRGTTLLVSLPLESSHAA